MSKQKYGMHFSDETSDATIELFMYRYSAKDWQQKAFHMKNVIVMLYPESLPFGRKGYLWSPWANRRLESWCRNNRQTWIGPSSSGKSTDAGMLVLVHWLSAPDKTTIQVCSTTQNMLEKRIFGKAVLKGTVEQSTGDMIGIHNDYNVLVIDEMQSTRRAAVEAEANLSTGREFKFLGMGNPVSRLDPLGEYSAPVDGWESVNPSMEEWKTKKGVTLFFDGRKSPAITEPDGKERYFFLLNQDQIDDVASSDGINSVKFWSQRIGFMPPEGLQNTLF